MEDDYAPIIPCAEYLLGVKSMKRNCEWDREISGDTGGNASIGFSLQNKSESACRVYDSNGYKLRDG